LVVTTLFSTFVVSNIKTLLIMGVALTMFAVGAIVGICITVVIGFVLIKKVFK
jgi:preprotein translocase subunit SecD